MPKKTPPDPSLPLKVKEEQTWSSDIIIFLSFDAN
jgi:hypothetical protein